MGRVKSWAAGLLLALVPCVAHGSYVMNGWNGNVAPGNSVTVNWTLHDPADSLLVMFALNGASGTFPNTFTDSNGNVYTLLKNSTGSPYPDQAGTLIGTYVCLKMSTVPSLGSVITSPVSGSGGYSYVIEWWLTVYGAGSSPVVIASGSTAVTDKAVWTFGTYAANASIFLPAYGSAIPDNTVSFGLWMDVNGTDFFHSSGGAGSPITFGGWDWGWDAFLGLGWNVNFPYNCYPTGPFGAGCSIDPGREQHQANSSTGNSAVAFYVVFHIAAPGPPPGGSKPVTQVWIG